MAERTPFVLNLHTNDDDDELNWFEQLSQIRSKTTKKSFCTVKFRAGNYIDCLSKLVIWGTNLDSVTEKK